MELKRPRQRINFPNKRRQFNRQFSTFPPLEHNEKRNRDPSSCLLLPLRRLVRQEKRGERLRPRDIPRFGDSASEGNAGGGQGGSPEMLPLFG